MIEIDFSNKTYTCPYCGCKQSYTTANSEMNYSGIHRNYSPREKNSEAGDINILTIVCNNVSCFQTTSVGYFVQTSKQIDLLPQKVFKQFPDFVPEQIRNDYEEACTIIADSPKAAATLLRRCLQGMIRDFWKICEKNLNAEITALKDKVSATQWNAIDGLRKIGNIGAHMEKDVNTIIDIDLDEASKLRMLIELLIDKWYIARHDEEALYSDITGIADEKEEQKTRK